MAGRDILSPDFAPAAAAAPAKKGRDILDPGFVTDDQIRADYRREQTEPGGWGGLHWGAAGQSLMDLGNVGAQGLTLGHSDEIKAWLASKLGPVKVGDTTLLEGSSYEDALADEQQKLRAAKIRMNEETPFSGQAFEGLTGMVGPGKLMAANPRWAWPAVGAATGLASAEGHDTDKLTGAVAGGLGGAFGAGGSWLMQRAAPLLSRALGASVGSFFGSPTAGAIVGGGATGPIRALGRATASGSGRDALATVANTPGAAGVPAAEAVQNMPFVEDMHRPAFVDWLAKQLQ